MLWLKHKKKGLWLIFFEETRSRCGQRFSPDVLWLTFPSITSMQGWPLNWNAVWCFGPSQQIKSEIKWFDKKLQLHKTANVQSMIWKVCHLFWVFFNRVLWVCNISNKIDWDPKLRRQVSAQTFWRFNGNNFALQWWKLIEIGFEFCPPIFPSSCLNFDTEDAGNNSNMKLFVKIVSNNQFYSPIQQIFKVNPNIFFRTWGRIWRTIWWSTDDGWASNFGFLLNLFSWEIVTKFGWSTLGRVTKFLECLSLKLLRLSLTAIFLLLSHDEAITSFADLPRHWMFCFVGLDLS